MSEFTLYHGDGSTVKERGQSLPAFQPMTLSESPENYVATPALRDAVNVAIALGQPLLLTGEPGTGKTRLAYSIAYELGVGQPLVFYTKTTSVARDLFYLYDSMRHFHDAQLHERSALDAHAYIHYQALGQAIIRSEKEGKRSVVLIDEIDKAPRDLPNDILNELEHMRFTVQETGESFQATQAHRPILVMTSNSEKNLPDPFLRRVVYYHIPFPDRATLMEIVRKRLRLSESFQQHMLEEAVRHFEDIRRNKGLRKPPATAELLAWIHILDREGIDLSSNIPEQVQRVAMSYSILAKNKEDLDRLR